MCFTYVKIFDYLKLSFEESNSPQNSKTFFPKLFAFTLGSIIILPFSI